MKKTFPVILFFLLSSSSIVFKTGIIGAMSLEADYSFDKYGISLSKDYTFCWGSISVTLKDGGIAVMNRYNLEGQLIKSISGEWTAYGSPNDLPGQTIKIKYETSEELFRYDLIRDGSGSPSVLIDGEGRNYKLCNSTESRVSNDIVDISSIHSKIALKQFAGEFNMLQSQYSKPELDYPKTAIIQSINQAITLTLILYNNNKIIIPFSKRQTGPSPAYIQFERDGMRYEVSARIESSIDFNSIRIIKTRIDDGQVYFNEDFYRNSNARVSWDYTGKLNIVEEEVAYDAKNNLKPKTLETFIDSRDGHKYNLTKIGAQIWMAENLAYLPSVSPSFKDLENNPVYYVYGYEGTNVSSAKSTLNFRTFGVLYNYDAAKSACPTGWSLPTNSDWELLQNNINAQTYKLIQFGNEYWGKSFSEIPVNITGFSAVPGGIREVDGNFNRIGQGAYFWSTESTDLSIPLCWNIQTPGLGYWKSPEKSYGFSIRCIKREIKEEFLNTKHSNLNKYVGVFKSQHPSLDRIELIESKDLLLLKLSIDTSSTIYESNYIRSDTLYFNTPEINKDAVFNELYGRTYRYMVIFPTGNTSLILKNASGQIIRANKEQ